MMNSVNSTSIGNNPNIHKNVTFKTGVKNPANPSAVPLTVLITFCMIYKVIYFGLEWNVRYYLQFHVTENIYYYTYTNFFFLF